MADPLATPAELATWLRTATEDEAEAGNPDILDTAAAILALTAASGSIRSVCGWSITEETATTRFYGWSPQTLFLPTLMLTDLSITVGGDPVASAFSSANGLFSWEPNGIVRLYGYRTWGLTSAIEVTYTHGYPSVPDVIKGVCLEVAAQRYLNPAQNLSETSREIVTVFARSTESESAVAALVNDARLTPYRLGSAVG